VAESTTLDLFTELTAEREQVDRALVDVCDRYLGALPGVVADAVRYSLLGEGKRLRPVLLLAAYQAARGAGDPYSLAGAIEIVHAYSLVHDDLPCMDDDDMRRGRPTTHKLFGVNVATAAGIAMVPLAALAAHDAAAALGLPAVERGSIVRELMRASGAAGMVGGQLLDLLGEGRTLEMGALARVHRAKTGALIVAAVRIGGIAALAPAHQLEALTDYGWAVGLAFQIADDVLDATSTTDRLGKTAGRDQALRKSTFVALLGAEGARAHAAKLAREGCERLREARMLSPRLEQLASYAVDRSR
jgi:geranylgeranyl diphosphate synthase type II